MDKRRKRFLITVLRFHGDVLLTTPIINSIKRVYPDAMIDLLVYRDTGVLLENDPRVANILEVQLSTKLSFIKRISSEINLLKRLRNNNYDFGLFLTTQWRVALIGRAIRPAKTAAVDDKKRKGPMWTKSFSYIFPEAGKNHIVERNLGALEILGLRIKKEDSKLRINIPESSRFFVTKCLKENSIGKDFCVIHPVSRRKSKQWSQESFASIVNHYSASGIKVILTSGPTQDEIDYLKGITYLSSNEVINLSGKTSLYDLSALIQRARFFVGLDSVASHIAAAVDTPGVVLFGPSKQENWRPWSNRLSVISRGNKEDYCDVHGHLEGKFKNCLCYITPEKVIKTVDSLIN